MDEEDRAQGRTSRVNTISPNDVGYPQYSGLSKTRIDPNPSRASLTPQLNQNLGIDRESIIEHYRNLRQQQKDILSRVNMKQSLKRQIFGFPDSYYCSNEAQKLKLVTIVDAFAGRMVVTEQKWKQIEALKLDKRKKERQNRTSYPNFPKEDVDYKYPNDERKAKNLIQRKVDKSIDSNKGFKQRSQSKGNEQGKGSREKKDNNQSAENGSNVEKALLAMLGQKESKPKKKQMDFQEIGEEIFENKKSQISSIHDPEQNGDQGIIDSADNLMGLKYEQK